MNAIKDGRYSHLPKWYKEAYFQETMPIKSRHDKAVKHAIVFKTALLRKMIERDLNVKLDDSTELGPKPNLRDEILLHPFEETQEELDIKSRRETELAFLEDLKSKSISEKFADLYKHQEKFNTINNPK